MELSTNHCQFEPITLSVDVHVGFVEAIIVVRNLAYYIAHSTSGVTTVGWKHVTLRAVATGTRTLVPELDSVYVSIAA